LKAYDLFLVLVRAYERSEWTERSVTAFDFVRSAAVTHDPANAGKQLADLASHTVSQKPTLLFLEVRRVAGFIGRVPAHLVIPRFCLIYYRFFFFNYRSTTGIYTASPNQRKSVT